MAAAGWVLTGRDEELRFARDVLSGAEPGSPGGLVVRGAPGVGKTRLVRETLDAVDRDLAIVPVVASAAAAAIPLSPFSHLIPDDEPAPGDPGDPGDGRGRLEPVDLLWTSRRLRAHLQSLAAGRPLVVAVDDAHLLDDASVALVQQLALTREARLVLTVRAGEPCPAEIVALWKDEVCGLLDLQPLSRGDLGRLVASVLGAWLDTESLDRFFEVSGGNPLFARELLSEAQSTGAFRAYRGIYSWQGPASAPRLVGLVAGDLDRLGAEERAFIDLLAVGEPLPIDVARALATTGVLASLERSGTVTIDHAGDGRVRFGHPLFGEVGRSRLGPMQIEALSARLAEAFEAAGGHHPDDLLRVVTWRRASHTTVSPAALFESALVARERGDAALAEDLVSQARREGATPAMDLLHAEILELGGRPHEAAALLDGLVDRLDEDRDRARALATEIRVLTHGLRRPDEAERAASRAGAIGDPVWRGYVTAQWATLLAMAGRLDEAAPLATQLFAMDDPRVRLRALPARNLVAFAEGRLDDALGDAQDLVGPALALRDEVPVGTSLVMSSLGIDLRALGRFDDLDALLAIVHADPFTALPANRAYVLLIEGSLALDRGQVAVARRLLAECVERFGTTDPQGYRPAATSLLAQACALGGDGPTAVEFDREAAQLIDARAPRLIDLDSARCRAWTPVSLGDPATARRRLESAAEAAAAAGVRPIELQIRHDLLRLGGGPAVARRIVALAGQVDGVFSAAAGAHAEARLARSADGVADAGERFAHFGALLVAADVLAEAAQQHAAAGARAPAQRCADRSRALAARCEGAVPPVTPPVDAPALTPRELQVARLAAAGRSSREIAEALVVSRRTVDNQLGRVYAKLGVAGRDDLAGALADLDLAGRAAIER